jgi:hypothetical protein
MAESEISGIAPFFIVNDVPTALAFYWFRGYISRTRASGHFPWDSAARCRDAYVQSHRGRSSSEPHEGCREGRARWDGIY